MAMEVRAGYLGKSGAPQRYVSLHAAGVPPEQSSLWDAELDDMAWGTRDGPSSLSRETRAPKGSVHPKHPRSHFGWRRPDPHATLLGRCTRPDDADLTPRAPPRRGAPECRCGKA